MVFSSTIFLFAFFPVVLILYFGPQLFLGQKYKKVISVNAEGTKSSTIADKQLTEYKNIILLIASIFFYAYGEGVLVLLIIASIIFNYFAGLMVSDEKYSRGLRKLFIVIAIIANLSLLFVYKYLDFILRTVNDIFHVNIPYTGLALPIGISFFTFQAISYIVDVYWGMAKVQKNPLRVGLYISLFPQLVAGPIVRYQTVADQMNMRTESIDKFGKGLARFLTGLIKKVMLADTMALIADRIFHYQNAWNPMTVGLAWLGATCYTLQVYYDFSGYSDMAIGLGKMFGFDFEENFNYPYISKSITEFWHRWHISLSTWFRDYLFYPVQKGKICEWIRKKYKGNKKKVRFMTSFFATFIVWCATGIWHGANWTFLCWGLLFFVMQFLEEITGYEKKWKLPSPLAHIYAMAVVIISFVIFRSDSMYMAAFYIAQMFGIKVNGICDATVWFYFKDNWMFFVAAVLFATPVGKKLEKKPGLQCTLIFAAFMLALLYILKGSYSPFIYFNF